MRSFAFGSGREPETDIKLFVQATLAYRFAQAAEVMLRLEAARTSRQSISQETLEILPHTPVTRLEDPNTGERSTLLLAEGDVEIRYAAVVDVARPQTDLHGLPAHPVRELPLDALTYLLPSRYCPSERFEAFVEKTFGSFEGGDKVQAILAWIADNLSYQAGASTSTSTAIDTFTSQSGVCRDFGHLAVTFCRAANIPARVVSAYSWRLEPPDMHAVAEVYLGGCWRLIDPTGLAPLEGMVRVASGRDAGDIAFMTVFGQAELLGQTFAVTELQGCSAT